MDYPVKPDNDRERRMSGNNREGIKPDNDGLLCCHT